MPFRRLTILALALAIPLPSLAATVNVSVGGPGFSYTPQEVHIHPGDTVVWTNADERDHTVTADDGSFKSPNLGDGEHFTQKFDKVGKYKYHCEYHPRMKAIVVVEE